MLSNYLAAALRDLVRNRVQAAINLFGLAVGFAAALLIGLYVHDQLTYDHFFPDYQDVYLLTGTKDYLDNRLLTEQWDFSSPDWAAKLRAQFPQMAVIARIMTTNNPPHIRQGQVEADETGFLWVDPAFFRVMPLKSLAGDLQTALTAPDSVVLTRTAARKYFGRDDPVGELLDVNPDMGPDAGKVSTAFNTTHPMRVTAVIEDLPSNSYVKGEVFGSSLAAYSPFGLYDLTPDRGPFRALESSYTFIRLRLGTPVRQVRRELSAFASRNAPVYPPGFTVGLHLTSIADLHLSPPGVSPLSPRGDRRLLAALVAIAILIITSASFNFVALTTARGAQRAIETGVRKAAGALRSQLMVQFLGEAVIHVALAMLVALVLTVVLLPKMNSVLKQEVAVGYLADPALLGVLLLATLGLGLMAGAYPALVLSAYRPAAVLKGGLVHGAGGGVVGRTLVALQFAIMIGLGITAATIWRQTLFSLNNSLRVHGSAILLIDGACGPSASAFRDRLVTLPGVTTAACASGAAVFNGGMIVSARTGGEAATTMLSGAVDYGALELYGLRPLAGRFFDRNHGGDGLLIEGRAVGNASIVVNETGMRALGFSSPSRAIGQIVTWNRREWSVNPSPGTIGSSEIIGVAPDFTLDTRRPAWPQIFYVDQAEPFDWLSVRLIGSQIPEALTAIDGAWSQMMHTSISRHFLSRDLQEMYADIMLAGTAISLGASLAVLIAALGLFGMAAHAAEQRTKEIGIRKAMGASRADVLRMLLWQFARPVLWGNLLAWLAAGYLMHRWLQGFASHVNLDPLIFLGAGAAALAIALATVISHALLVARTKPAMALRYE